MGLTDCAGDECDGAHGCIVARYRILHEREIAIGDREADDGDFELIGLKNSRVLVTRIHDEECRGQVGHLYEPAEATQELGNLAVYHETLALRVFLQRTACPLAHKLFEAVDAFADILEIGECASYPAAFGIRRAHKPCAHLFYRVFFSSPPPTRASPPAPAGWEEAEKAKQAKKKMRPGCVGALRIPQAD